MRLVQVEGRAVRRIKGASQDYQQPGNPGMAAMATGIVRLETCLRQWTILKKHSSAERGESLSRPAWRAQAIATRYSRSFAAVPRSDAMILALAAQARSTRSAAARRRNW